MGKKKITRKPASERASLNAATKAALKAERAKNAERHAAARMIETTGEEGDPRTLEEAARIIARQARTMGVDVSDSVLSKMLGRTDHSRPDSSANTTLPMLRPPAASGWRLAVGCLACLIFVVSMIFVAKRASNGSATQGSQLTIGPVRRVPDQGHLIVAGRDEAALMDLLGGMNWASMLASGRAVKLSPGTRYETIRSGIPTGLPDVYGTEIRLIDGPDAGLTCVVQSNWL